MNKETEQVENECNLQQQRLEQEFEMMNKLMSFDKDSEISAEKDGNEELTNSK